MHVGHKAAVWPDVFKYKNEGNEEEQIKSFKWQKVIREFWDDFWNQDEVKDAEYVVNLAESIEGKNDKEYGKNLMTVDLNRQVEAFAELIKPKLKGKKYIGISGSKYHESGDMESEALIAKILGGEWHYCMVNKRFGRWIIQFSHQISDSCLYKSTALDRNSLFLDASEGSGKLNFHIDIIACGHEHSFFLNQNESRISFIAPCWKCWHPIRKYGAKDYARRMPTIGGCVIELGKTAAVKLYNYPLPHVYDALR